MKTIYPTIKSDSSPFVLNHILAELYKIKIIISVSVFCSSVFSSVLSALCYSPTNPDPGLQKDLELQLFFPFIISNCFNLPGNSRICFAQRCKHVLKRDVPTENKNIKETPHHL